MAAQKTKVVVFGGGSFGTALGYLVAKNNHNVVIISRNQKVVDSINKEHKNCDYVSDFKLPDNITATTDAKEALKDANFIIHAIPVQSSQSFLENMKSLIPETVPIISSSKGLHSETLETMNEIIPKALGRSNHPVAYISGPTFAKEILSDMPSGVVVAAVNPELANTVALLFNSPSLRAYTSTDVIGVEVAGALKNVFALAAGCAAGLGLGLNSKAMLVTRGCSEMTKLATKLGAKPETLAGLAGIGDLMLTCFGSMSRNQTVGRRLGEGESLDKILASMNEVAEGVATTPAAVKLAAKLGIDTPIINAMQSVLIGETSPKDALQKLMTLPTGPESNYIVVI